MIHLEVACPLSPVPSPLPLYQVSAHLFSSPRLQSSHPYFQTFSIQISFSSHITFCSISMATNSISESTKSNLYPHDKDELQKVFNRFDANGDGKISSSELAEVMRALGSVSSPEEMSRVMEEIDTDRDGYINLEEFAQFCKSGSNADSGELRDAFELYDEDKNGLISAVELHQVLKRLGEKCSVQDCQKMIGSFDSNGDGNISFEEFKEMMTKSKSKHQ